jgi:hypothetical protein
MVAYTYNTSYCRGRNKRIVVGGQPLQKHESPSKTNFRKIKVLGTWLKL